MKTSEGVHRSVSRWRLALLLLWPAIVAMGLQLYGTARYGPGLSPDSAIYLQGARQLSKGLGFTQFRPTASGVLTVPITWYPPAYSALLSVGPSVGVELVPFARLASAALLGLSVTLGVGMVWWMTRSVVATLVAGFVIGLAPDQLEAYAYALSEPLFIVALLVGFACLAKYLSRLNLLWLLAAALAVSLAAMTRYVGLLVVPLGGLIVLLFSSHRPLIRLRDAVLFGLIAAGPNMLWTVRNRSTAGSGTGRKIEWHPVGWTHFHDLFDTFTDWLIPTTQFRSASEYLWWIGPAVGLVALVFAVRELRSRGWRGAIDRTRCRPGGYLGLVLIAFVFAYIPGMLASISLVDAATPMDFRTLAPLYIPIAVCAIGACIVAWRRAETMAAKPVIRGGILILMAAVMITGFVRSPRWSWRNYATGERLTYNSKRWHTSAAIRAIRRLPPGLSLWTNASDAIYLQTARVDRLIPPKYAPDGKRQLETYPRLIAEVRKEVMEGRAGLVYFRGVLRRPQALPADLDADFKGLERVEFPNDAVFYATPTVARQLR